MKPIPPCTWMPSDATSMATSVANALPTGVNSAARSLAARRSADSWHRCERSSPAAVAVDHRAGRARVDSELVLEAAAADVVVAAVGQHLRNQEQRYSARALRGVGQSRQNEMHDVVGEVVLAVADEDFLSADPIAAVAARLRPGANRAEVGARLRFGQIHRRRPLAGDELAQISLLEVFATVRGERFHAAESQERGNAESEAGAIPHLGAAGI